MRVLSLLLAAPALLLAVRAQSPVSVSVSNTPSPSEPSTDTSAPPTALAMPAIYPSPSETTNTNTNISGANESDAKTPIAIAMPAIYEIKPVPCKADADCSDSAAFGMPFCHEGTCGPCTTVDGLKRCADMPMVSPGPMIEPMPISIGEAIDCKTDGDCSGQWGLPFCSPEGKCSGCKTDDNGMTMCASAPLPPMPAVVDGGEVSTPGFNPDATACKTDSDCTAMGYPFCTEGVCSACGVDANGMRMCAALHFTGEIMNGTDTKDSSIGIGSNPSDMSCTEASQCTSRGFPFCDQGKCYACKTDANGQVTMCARGIATTAIGGPIETEEGSGQVPRDGDANGVVAISAPVGGTNGGNTDNRVTDNKNDGFLSSKETQDGGVATTRDTPDNVDSGAGRNAAVWGVCGVVAAMLMM